MGELTYDNLFDKAFDATAASIRSTGFSAKQPWSNLIPALRQAVSHTFNSTGHLALEDLRVAVKDAGTGNARGTFLAGGAGVTNGSSSGRALEADEVARCAALKLLRHTYFHERRACQKLWIVSLPESFSHWPHTHLNCNSQQFITRLSDEKEFFSETERAHISDATQRGLRWIHKAQLALDDLGTGSRGLLMLKRWFADEDTTDNELRSFGAGKLRDGLKKIAPKMSSGSLIVTDFVPIRHSSDRGDQQAAASNAFVTQADARDVIYIERPFFSRDASAVFQKDERHWARIMVHEMTHREAGTKDNRYGWKGLKPKKSMFPSGLAMTNADSWALFTAHPAGAMSKSEISASLGVTAP